MNRMKMKMSTNISPYFFSGFNQDPTIVNQVITRSFYFMRYVRFEFYLNPTLCPEVFIYKRGDTKMFFKVEN